MAQIKTSVGTVDVNGGKEIVVENIDGFADGERIVAFKNNETCKVKITWEKDYKGVKHVPDGTVVEMHVIEAAMLEKIGRCKIVKE